MAVNGIDTRDLIQERDELQARLDDQTADDPIGEEPLDDEDEGRLADIEELLNAVGGEAQHGVYLIPDYDFEEYAQELAEEIGAIPEGSHWPVTCIDWEQAARELEVDYSSVEFDGDTYLYRA